MKIGCHVGGSQEDILEGVKFAITMALDGVQVFVNSPLGYHIGLPNAAFWELYNRFPVLVHSPYWVGFFSERIKEIQVKYLDNLRDRYVREVPIRYVTHLGYPTKESGIKTQQQMIDAALKTLEGFRLQDKRVRVLLENSSGKGSAPNLTLESLYKIKERADVGIVLDSEHAFAAGEDLLSVPLECEVIHLNGIPRYVKHGGTCDRHSFTLLDSSKPIIKEFIKRIGKDTLCVLERREFGIIKKDVEFLRNG